MELSPFDPVSRLPGVSPRTARDLRDAGVVTALDLLLHLPFRYEDRTNVAAISALAAGGPPATVAGTVLSARLIRTRRPGFTIFEALLDDGSGSIRLVFFNQPYLSRVLTEGRRVWVFGTPEAPTRGRRGLVMENPQYEPDDGAGDPLSVGRVVPIYRKLPGLPPRTRRRLAARLLDELGDRLPDRFPAELVRRRSLPPLAAALREAHFPGSAGGSAEPGPWVDRTSPHLARLFLEEFLELQVALVRRRAERAAVAGPRLAADEASRSRLRA
ncbi:MAG TPA: OB-fold nucleic acid binding domain-containing protein, partial [Thermoanaerobaculia bacterium]|nr:OB-fold nucleic acid binding domain-containing protein [Thermoanaerobaculia bacterium]